MGRGRKRLRRRVRPVDGGYDVVDMEEEVEEW